MAAEYIVSTCVSQGDLKRSPKNTICDSSTSIPPIEKATAKIKKAEWRRVMNG